ncbi:hypothetical protein JHK86_044380 [Glycine max]|nr:hypothetical protein JHK86_044380 [Glycine max]
MLLDRNRISIPENLLNFTTLNYRLLSSSTVKGKLAQIKEKRTVDPALVAAEEGVKVVKVMQDGSGKFKTITDAINNIRSGNTKRPLISLYGVLEKMPNLTYGGTAQQYGTVELDYFVAAN